MPAKKQGPDLGSEVIVWSDVPLDRLIAVDPASDTALAHLLRDVAASVHVDEVDASAAFDSSL